MNSGNIVVFSAVLRWLLLPVALLGGWSASARPDSGYGDVLRRDWFVYESKYFRVISDQPEANVGRQIHDLELFRTYVLATLDQQANRERLSARTNPEKRRLLDAQPVAEHERVDVYLFSRRAHLVGVYVPAINRGYHSMRIAPSRGTG